MTLIKKSKTIEFSLKPITHQHKINKDNKKIIWIVLNLKNKWIIIKKNKTQSKKVWEIRTNYKIKVYYQTKAINHLKI